MDPQPATPIHGLPPPGAPVRHSQQLIFDFTKRKRWADLLVTELTEAVMLVLSDTGVVWYCGPAVEDLLGWADEDLVDGTLFEIMNENDREVFERQFEDAIQQRTDLLSYVRLRCKSEHDRYGSTTSAKEVLFEIKGYAHYVVSSNLSASLSGFDIRDLHALSAMDGRANHSTGVHQDGIFKCFFAMAKPYPSRNTAMLNTFLELKIENERLHQRLRDAKAREAELDGLEAKHQDLSTLTLAQPSPYAAGGGGHLRASTIPPTHITTALRGSPDASAPVGEPADPSADHTLPRKKNKKTFAREMHCCMTCGRTESPEWRKGPQGPKTLCNACGLRWAKSARRDPNVAEGEGGAAGAQ
ncbi:hypothetical protein PHLGIDRAFT_62123 [Phlebiopsis gigantea 11061_1 CR5-6]|uniref:Blue light receptor n=1 Tax=Phlebiopsis gigantea (strain 11061_1 CR5-6) TaxID=745531 RepID=A0A0C3S7C8_PHLG1|nr:hypothetical protein PHLGIDRAFT_62123 [Phlebiopsis gigantea 11061_1 CR5-6]